MLRREGGMRSPFKDCRLYRQSQGSGNALPGALMRVKTGFAARLILHLPRKKERGRLGQLDLKLSGGAFAV